MSETLFAIPFQKPEHRQCPDANVMERRPMSLYDEGGGRKYLTPEERQAFLRAARAAAPDIRTFCETPTHTGCRISEALALTADRVDSAAGVLVFQTLKKRRRGIYRAVPVPPAFLDMIVQVHGLLSTSTIPDR